MSQIKPALTQEDLDERSAVCVNCQTALSGHIVKGIIKLSPCSRCSRTWEQAYTKATGRTKNMAPEGYKYVCSHKTECHFDRSGPMSSGYPYHAKAGTVCSDPGSVHRVPENLPMALVDDYLAKTKAT